MNESALLAAARRLDTAALAELHDRNSDGEDDDDLDGEVDKEDGGSTVG